jgi:rhamnosyltransferase
MSTELKVPIKNGVYAIIISYFGKTDVIKCIYALKDQLEAVVVIDNGSDANSLELLRDLELKKIIFLIELGANYGVGYALNRGISYAKSQLATSILTMDQDSIADENMVSTMLNFKKESFRSDIVATSPYLLLSGVKKINQKMLETSKVDFAITSGNLLPISIFDNIGFFDENLFIDGVDFDFCYRLKLKGIKLYKVSGAVLHHNLGEIVSFKLPFYSFDITIHGPTRRYYLFRNHLYLISRYFMQLPIPLIKKSAYEFLLLTQILLFEKSKINNIKMIYLGAVDFLKGVEGRFSHKL